MSIKSFYKCLNTLVDQYTLTYPRINISSILIQTRPNTQGFITSSKSHLLGHSPVLQQVSPQRDLGEDPAAAIEVELEERQTFAGRVDQTRERTHADEGNRRPIFAGRSGQQQRARRHPAEDQTASADQFASVWVSLTCYDAWTALIAPLNTSCIQRTCKLHGSNAARFQGDNILQSQTPLLSCPFAKQLTEPQRLIEGKILRRAGERFRW